MASYSETVNDDYGRPIPGVSVFVYNRDGTLASLLSGGVNPTTTDNLGRFSFDAADGVYAIEYRFAGQTKRLDNVLVGDPPEYHSTVPGPANSTYTSLALLKAAPSTSKSYTLVANGGRTEYAYIPGDFTGRADDVTIIKLDAVPLATGALVRQGAQSITYDARQTVADKLNLFANVTDARFGGGAKGDGVTNDTAAIRAARDSGARELIFPKGTYLAGSLAFTEGDQVASLRFEPGSRILVPNDSNGVGIDIQKQVFSITGICDVKSTGSMTDGRATVGIRHGNTTQGQAYLQIDRLRVEGFSARGFVSYAPVNALIGRVDGYSCGYAVSFEAITLAGGSIGGGTVLQCKRAYLSGCLRGLSLDGGAWAKIETLTVEYSGSDTSIDGAIHLRRSARLVIENRYGEQNKRNMVLDDSTAVFIGGEMFAATVPDTINYQLVAFDDRGCVEINNNMVRAARFGPDRLTGMDGRIGADFVMPIDGGPNRWGRTTNRTFSGTAVSGVWTTVAPILGQTGDAQARRIYDYVIRLGSADKSTGIDSGKIMNGVIYSASGTVPAWLRIDTDKNLQVNVTQTDYGLSYSAEILLRNGSAF